MRKHCSRVKLSSVCKASPMALQQVKTEMKGDTSRWCHREEAKRSARKRRREVDRRAAREDPEDRWRRPRAR